MEQAMRVLGTDVSETLMVGDNYDTDIMAGMNAGMDTLLVHTGVTTKSCFRSTKSSQPMSLIHYPSGLSDYHKKEDRRYARVLFFFILHFLHYVPACLMRQQQ